MVNKKTKQECLNLFSKQCFAIGEGQNIGIYFLYQENEIIYVGKSLYLFFRPFQHKDKHFDRVVVFPTPIDWIDFLESAFIGLLKPRLNGFRNKKRKTSHDYGVRDSLAFSSPIIALNTFKDFQSRGFLTDEGIVLQVVHAQEKITRFLYDNIPSPFESDDSTSPEATACPSIPFPSFRGEPSPILTTNIPDLAFA